VPLIGHLVGELLRSWLPTPPTLSLLPLIPRAAAKKTKEAAVLFPLLLLFIVFFSQKRLIGLNHFIFIAIGVVNKV
jgi:hypothetical protein